MGGKGSGEWGSGVLALGGFQVAPIVTRLPLLATSGFFFMNNAVYRLELYNLIQF